MAQKPTFQMGGPLNTEERQKSIVQFISKFPDIAISRKEMAARYNVSERAIKTDFAHLLKTNQIKLVKSHGSKGSNYKAIIRVTAQKRAK